MTHKNRIIILSVLLIGTALNQSYAAIGRQISCPNGKTITVADTDAIGLARAAQQTGLPLTVSDDAHVCAYRAATTPQRYSYPYYAGLGFAAAPRAAAEGAPVPVPPRRAVRQGPGSPEHARARGNWQRLGDKVIIKSLRKARDDAQSIQSFYAGLYRNLNKQHLLLSELARRKNQDIQALKGQVGQLQELNKANRHSIKMLSDYVEELKAELNQAKAELKQEQKSGERAFREGMRQAAQNIASQQRIEELLEELRRMLQALRELGESKSQNEMEIEALLKSGQANRQIIQHLQDRTAQQEDALSQQAKKMRELQAEIVGLVRQNRDLQSALEELRGANQQLRASATTLSGEVARYKSMWEKQFKDNGDNLKYIKGLEKAIQGAEERVEQLRALSNELRTENALLGAQRGSERAVMQEQAATIGRLKADCEVLRSLLNEANARVGESDINVQARAQLADQVHNLTVQLAALSAENKGLKSALEEAQFATRAALDRLRTSELDGRTSRTEINALKESLATEKQKFKEVQDSLNRDIQELVQDLTAMKQSQTRSDAAWDAVNTKLRTKTAALEAELSKLEANLNAQRVNEAELRDTIRQLKAENSQLPETQSTLRELSAQLADLNKTVKENQDELAKKDKEVSRISAQLVLADRAHHAADARAGAAEGELEKVNASLQKLERSQADLNRQLRALKQENEGLRTENAAGAEEIETNNKRIQELRRQLDQAPGNQDLIDQIRHEISVLYQNYKNHLEGQIVWLKTHRGEGSVKAAEVVEAKLFQLERDMMQRQNVGEGHRFQ